MRRNATKIAAAVLSLAVTMTSVSIPTDAAAATKKVKINKTKATEQQRSPSWFRDSAELRKLV